MSKWCPLLIVCLVLAAPWLARADEKGSGEAPAAAAAGAGSGEGGSLHQPIPVPADSSMEPVTPSDEKPPAWVLAEPVREGKVHRTTVSSGPHALPEDCAKALDVRMKAATDEYVDWWIQRQFGYPGASAKINLDLDYIKQHLRHPDYQFHEVRQYSVGPMHTSYALLEFDEPFRKDLGARWEALVAQSRLLRTAVVSAAVLAVLAILFALFQLDTLTGGFYTGRLRAVAAAAILVVVIAGVIVAQRVATF